MRWFLMAGFVHLFAKARSLDALFTGLAMAILWQTREEGFLLLAALAVFCAIQAFRIYVTRVPQQSFGNALLRPLVIISQAKTGCHSIRVEHAHSIERELREVHPAKLENLRKDLMRHRYDVTSAVARLEYIEHLAYARPE